MLDCFFSHFTLVDFVPLQMPVMDGFEATKRFRTWEDEQQQAMRQQGKTPLPHVPIVGMSANSDAQSRQDALDSGMDAFCPKPFNFKELQATLTRLKVSK